MHRKEQSPATAPVLSLRKSIYRAAHDYHGGVTALAIDMVMDYDSLQKKVKHDFEQRWLDPDELEEVMALKSTEMLPDMTMLFLNGSVSYRPAVPVL